MSSDIINIFLGTINRSGGSLFCRLLDGHPDVASYPKEMHFPNNKDVAPNMEIIAGYPRYIPNYKKTKFEDVFKLANIPKTNIEPVHKWGKEKSDPIGVRKNYLEKDLSPIGDMRASKEYRIEIAKNLLMKCFVEINSNKLSRVN